MECCCPAVDVAVDAAIIESSFESLAAFEFMQESLFLHLFLIVFVASSFIAMMIQESLHVLSSDLSDSQEDSMQ